MEEGQYLEDNRPSLDGEVEEATAEAALVTADASESESLLEESVRRS
jgi:hypothetical protein